uniref:Hydroxysteroid dehydrogenase-like protein 2 n=1 Tax=Steinernema glaseri TaxID=37863 RepID=A0A1I7ZU88_9BILA
MFNTGKFAGKTAIISGASRGIGKAIALKLAKDGANIVIAAKTATAHPKLPGTIYTAAEEIEKAGGKSLPCIVDVRDEASVQTAVEEAVKKFGGIDILINNASAISLTGTLDTPMKRYDLMNQVNARGTFLMSQKCIPYLKQSKNPHILNISPPLVMETHWFANHVAYTMAKYGMSMCVLGMHEELRPDGIAVNALWPRTAIWTAAMEMLSGDKEEGAKGCRTPDIMADAAYALLSRNSREFTGNFVIDDEILRDEGVTDFDKYAIDPNVPLMPDFFLPGVQYGEALGRGDEKRSKSRKALKMNDMLEGIKKIINSELVGRIGAVYEFAFKGEPDKTFYIDLKNGSGSVGMGKAAESDVQFELKTEDFIPMFTGKLSPTQAFMSGKLKIQGNMGKAIQLEGIFKKLNKAKL